MPTGETKRVADLAGIAVFYERWRFGEDSGFDTELDFAVQRRLEERGALDGICGLHAVPTTFRLEGESLREGLLSEDCGSSRRDRELVAAVSWGLFGDPYSSLPATCAWMRVTGRRAYVAGTTGAFVAALLAQLPAGDVVCSEYFGPVHAPGALVGGVRHEDLERLSFPDGSFDLVITADVMEHVADAVAAEREIVRVLRPGGAYCFSVPFYDTLEHDRIRAVAGSDGRVEHFETPEYHGDPLRPEGALVFRDYSEPDLRERFSALGCSFGVLRSWSKTLGILGADAAVMVVRRAE